MRAQPIAPVEYIAALPLVVVDLSVTSCGPGAASQLLLHVCSGAVV